MLKELVLAQGGLPRRSSALASSNMPSWVRDHAPVDDAVDGSTRQHAPRAASSLRR